MKSFVPVALLCALAALTGCKPDAAVKRGAMVDAGPNTSSKDVRKPGTTIQRDPSVDKDHEVKPVQ